MAKAVQNSSVASLVEWATIVTEVRRVDDLNSPDDWRARSPEVQ